MVATHTFSMHATYAGNFGFMAILARTAADMCVCARTDSPFHYSLDLSAVSSGDSLPEEMSDGDATLLLSGEYVSHRERRSPLGPTIFKQRVTCNSCV